MMAFDKNAQLQKLVGNNAFDQLAVQPRYANQTNPYETSPMMRPQQVNFQPINQNQDRGYWGSIKDYLFGSPAQVATSSPYTPFQRQAFTGLQNAGQAQLNNPYGGFDELQKQFMDYFNEQIVPNIAERFTSLGGGALSSPAFAQQLSAGGRGLASQLLQHKLDYGRQNREFGMRQLQAGLTPQYEQQVVPGQEGFFNTLAGRTIPAASNVLGARYFGGQ